MAHYTIDRFAIAAVFRFLFLHLQLLLLTTSRLVQCPIAEFILVYLHVRLELLTAVEDFLTDLTRLTCGRRRRRSGTTCNLESRINWRRQQLERLWFGLNGSGTSGHHQLLLLSVVTDVPVLVFVSTQMCRQCGHADKAL